MPFANIKIHIVNYSGLSIFTSFAFPLLVRIFSPKKVMWSSSLWFSPFLLQCAGLVLWKFDYVFLYIYIDEVINQSFVCSTCWNRGRGGRRVRAFGRRRRVGRPRRCTRRRRICREKSSNFPGRWNTADRCASDCAVLGCCLPNGQSACRSPFLQHHHGKLWNGRKMYTRLNRFGSLTRKGGQTKRDEKKKKTFWKWSPAHIRDNEQCWITMSIVQCRKYTANAFSTSYTRLFFFSLPRPGVSTNTREPCSIVFPVGKTNFLSHSVLSDSKQKKNKNLFLFEKETLIRL